MTVAANTRPGQVTHWVADNQLAVAGHLCVPAPDSLGQTWLRGVAVMVLVLVAIVVMVVLIAPILVLVVAMVVLVALTSVPSGRSKPSL